MYEEIKKNIIDRFLNKYYLWTCCTTKESIITDMEKRLPFDVKYLYFGKDDVLEINLGDNIKVIVELKWEERSYKNSVGHNIINYRLISII